MEISGLYYRNNLITEEEEATLLQQIQAEPWDTTLNRRVQQYGHSYAYKAENRTVAPLPKWALDLFEHCRRHLPIPAINPDNLQVIVNEYLPGQGIAKHIDDTKQFSEWVLTVSLGSPCTMNFILKRAYGTETRFYTLDRRSAYLMTEEARYKWMHSIPARKGDRTGTRVSITFREQITTIS
jgi:alkylated DNA repair dioxygenase AlkB